MRDSNSDKFLLLRLRSRSSCLAARGFFGEKETLDVFIVIKMKNSQSHLRRSLVLLLCGIMSASNDHSGVATSTTVFELENLRL